MGVKVTFWTAAAPSSKCRSMAVPREETEAAHAAVSRACGPHFEELRRWRQQSLENAVTKKVGG